MIYNFPKIVWQWTYGGLPQWMISPGAQLTWARTILFSAQSDLDDQFHVGERIDIKLAPSLVHKRSLSFPRSAKNNLEKVISLSVRQSTPNSAKGITWQYTVDYQTSEMLDVTVYLIKTSLLDAIVHHTRKAGGVLRTISLDDTGCSICFVDNRSKSDRMKRVWNLISLLLLIGILVSLILKGESRLEILRGQESVVASQLEKLSAEALTLRENIKLQTTRREQVSSDVNLLLSQSSRLAIFASLTEALSDQTWISEAALDKTGLRLSIFSSDDVSEVVQIIRGLQWAETVDLDGPISFDSISRKNRFELRITLLNEVELTK